MKAVVRSLVFLLCAASLAAQLPAAWQAWRYSAPIVAPAAAPDRLISVRVPAFVTAHARRDWIDLRVIDRQGEEVPFVLLARTGGTSVARSPARLLDPTVIKNRYREVVADVGESGVVHNSLELRLDTTKNLMSWVEVAVSADLNAWRIVRDRAPIYVLRESGLGEKTEVTYPDSASRYLRIRVLDGSDTYRIAMVTIGRETRAVEERQPVDVVLTPAADRLGASVWTSEGDASPWLVSRVSFEAPASSFNRPVVVERSDAGGQWQVVTMGTILRAPDSTGDRAWLAVDFPEATAHAWRITVDNRNDSPLAGLRPTLLAAVRRVVFVPQPGETYRLLYGNPRGRLANYDLAQRTRRTDLDSAEPATLGPEEENSAWVDPSPWTEKHDTALWIALIVAVGVLGAVAVRTLRAQPS